MQVSILGTKYTIQECTVAEDNYLNNCDGYCDKTSKRIVVAKGKDSDIDDFEVYRKKVMRHEIIHAFLYESGLWENFEHKPWGHEETMIDWIAVQYPKMLEVFQKAGCI